MHSHSIGYQVIEPFTDDGRRYGEAIFSASPPPLMESRQRITAWERNTQLRLDMAEDALRACWTSYRARNRAATARTTRAYVQLAVADLRQARMLRWDYENAMADIAARVVACGVAL